MRLLPGIHLVGSGHLGFSLSDRHDSHVYLVTDGDSSVLVDAGCGLGTEQILANVRACGVDPRGISHVLVTHAHPDHSAGAASLRSALGCTVLASEPVAETMRHGDEIRSGLRQARAAGTYPDSVRQHATPTATLADGAELAVGALTLRTLLTPGHADGHLCFLVELADGRSVVFTGDLVFARGRVAVLSTPDSNPALLGESIRRLAALDPDCLLPGHGSVVLSDAGEHLSTAVAAFDAGGLPESLTA